MCFNVPDYRQYTVNILDCKRANVGKLFKTSYVVCLQFYLLLEAPDAIMSDKEIFL